jgi:hypothetical protein
MKPVPLMLGRTEEDMFSSTLYRFDLQGSGLWETVQATGGKPPATAGHSMVFHSPSRTLLVYGGHRPTTARYAHMHTHPNKHLHTGGYGCCH